MITNFVIYPKERFSFAGLVIDENDWDIQLRVPSFLTGINYIEDNSLSFPDIKHFEGN